MNGTITISQNNNCIHLKREAIDLQNILLANNKSTVDIFGNQNSLSNIHSENGNMAITTNAKNLIIEIIGDFLGYNHTVW